jgi:hypothetical protein
MVSGSANQLKLDFWNEFVPCLVRQSEKAWFLSKKVG